MEEAVDLVIVVKIDQQVAVEAVEVSEEKVEAAEADKVEAVEAEAKIKLSGCL